MVIGFYSCSGSKGCAYILGIGCTAIGSHAQATRTMVLPSSFFSHSCHGPTTERCWRTRTGPAAPGTERIPYNPLSRDYGLRKGSGPAKCAQPRRRTCRAWNWRRPWTYVRAPAGTAQSRKSLKRIESLKLRRRSVAQYYAVSRRFRGSSRWLSIDEDIRAASAGRRRPMTSLADRASRGVGFEQAAI